MMTMNSMLFWELVVELGEHVYAWRPRVCQRCFCDLRDATDLAPVAG